MKVKMLFSRYSSRRGRKIVVSLNPRSEKVRYQILVEQDLLINT